MENAKLLMECNPEGIMAQLAVRMKSSLSTRQSTGCPPGRLGDLRQAKKVQFFTACSGADMVR